MVSAYFHFCAALKMPLHLLSLSQRKAIRVIKPLKTCCRRGLEEVAPDNGPSPDSQSSRGSAAPAASGKCAPLLSLPFGAVCLTGQDYDDRCPL